MRYLAVLLVIIASLLPNRPTNAQGGEDGEFLVPNRPHETHTMSLPTTGDPRMDLTALLALSATLMALADAVNQKLAQRHGGVSAHMLEPEETESVLVDEPMVALIAQDETRAAEAPVFASVDVPDGGDYHPYHERRSRHELRRAEREHFEANGASQG